MRLDLHPPTAYSWPSPQHILHPATRMVDMVFTAYLPTLFDIVPTPSDDPTIRFCGALAPWQHAALLAELQANTALCREIMDHAGALGLLQPARGDSPWPSDAPHWDTASLLRLVPIALYSLCYLQGRTYRPLPQSAAFRLQFYLAACQVGLFTHARPLPPDAPDAARHAWQDAEARHLSADPHDPFAWAQHPGPLGLTLHTALPIEEQPQVLACQCSPADLDAFLLEQVALYYHLHQP